MPRRKYRIGGFFDLELSASTEKFRTNTEVSFACPDLEVEIKYPPRNDSVLTPISRDAIIS